MNFDFKERDCFCKTLQFSGAPILLTFSHFPDKDIAKCLTDQEEKELFSPLYIPLTLADYLSESSPDIFSLRSTQRRGIRAPGVDMHLPYRAVCFHRLALLYAWQLLWAPNNWQMHPADYPLKIIQTYRAVSTVWRRSHCTTSLMYSLLILPSPSPLSTPLQLSSVKELV